MNKNADYLKRRFNLISDNGKRIRIKQYKMIQWQELIKMKSYTRQNNVNIKRNRT